MEQQSDPFIAPGARQIVIAHIPYSNEWDRTRASTTVLAYARATDQATAIYRYQRSEYTAQFDYLYSVDSHRFGCPPLVVNNLFDYKLALRMKALHRDKDRS